MSAVLTLLVVALVVLAAIAWFAPAVWVFADARRRRRSNAVPWTVAALATSYVGLVAYVVTGGSARSAVVSSAD